MKFNNPNILQTLWNEHADLFRVGLYYGRSKAVALPLARVKVDEKIINFSRKDLLTFFDQGLKIDIEPLNHLENNEIEINYEPQFVKR